MSVPNFEIRLEERRRKKAFAHHDCHSMIVDFGCPSKYRVLQERKNTTTGASAASLIGTQHHQQQQQQQQTVAQKNLDHHLASQNTNPNNILEHSYKNNKNNNNIPIINNGCNNNNIISFGSEKTIDGIHYHHHQISTDLISKSSSDIQGVCIDSKPNTNGNGTQNGSNNINNNINNINDPLDLGDGRENDLVLACPFFRNELGGEEERIICLNKLIDRREPPQTVELHKPPFVSGVSILETPTLLSHNKCPYQRNTQCNYVIDYADTGASYYREYFHKKDHQNWLGQSESYGPLAISIRKEPVKQNNFQHQNNSNNNNSNNISQNDQDSKYHYRIIIRTSELEALRGSVYEDCIPNLTNRSNTREVLEYLLAKSDIPLNKLRLATPNAESKILVLDEHRLTKTYKVGVLYCKANQSTEEEFYNNEHSGPLFDEFLSCIGENVRLLGFDKYRGGLDNKSDTTGKCSVYSTYDDCEIMFHVSTMLPYDSNKQQLARKRHIGNDIVTIVFQEEGALPFTPKTIRSQFQHVFIIVRALNPPLSPDGSYDYRSPRRYSLAVSRSKEMQPFGPPIPENNVFVRSEQFKNFLLAKVINAENAAHKYCEKFRMMGQRTRLGLLNDLNKDHVTNTTLADYNGGSNSGTSGAVKILSTYLMGKKRPQRRYANFCGHSEIRGAIVWDVQVKDFGQSNKIIDCMLGISSTYLVIIEQETKELLYATPVEAILGWTSNSGCIKIFCHQAECLLVQIKDPDVDEICEIVARLRAVSNGCETRELTLRRKNSQISLGFDIQPDGYVTRVESGSIAWQTHLLQGSRLVEICKTSTATLSFNQMMDYIRTSAVVTLTILPPNNDGTLRIGCLSQNCAHQPIISRHPSTFSGSSSSSPNNNNANNNSNTNNSSHFSKPKRRVPTTSLVTLV